jgi:hypothetical protein
MLAEIRPEFEQLMIDAWYNHFFVMAFAAPLILHLLGFVLLRFRWKAVAAIALPMSIFFCWASISLGVFHIYDVWAEAAVTESERGIVSNDSGRTFTPLFVAPPIAIAYSLGCYVLIGSIGWVATWRIRRRSTHAGPAT